MKNLNVKYYCIYDKEAEDFSAPIIAKTDADAKRMFKRFVSEQSEKDKYFVSSDYLLCKLEHYSDGNGDWSIVPYSNVEDLADV